MTKVGSHEVGVGLGAAESHGAAAAVEVELFEGSVREVRPCMKFWGALMSSLRPSACIGNT